MFVIFDLDGTVWDSRPGIVASLVHCFEVLDLEIPPEDVLSRHIGPPLRSMLADLGVAGADLDRGVAAYRDRYTRAGVYEAELYPGVLALLDGLRDRGDRLATATSKGHDPTLIMLDHFGIHDRFEFVGAATMDGRTTTKAAVLARTLAQLGSPGPSDCVMIGDRHHDVVGAATHHIECIGVTWGYGGEEELVSSGAWALARSPADVLSLVAQR